MVEMGDEQKEKIKVRILTRIAHSGLYDFEGFLSSVKEFFIERKYGIGDIEHSEMVKPAGKELKVDFLIFKDVNDYVRYEYSFEIVIYRQIDVMVEVNGKKVKRQQGDMEVRFSSIMWKNHRLTFKGPGSNFLRKTYERYLIRRELKTYKGALFKEGGEFADHLKKVLGEYSR
jgi:hypothetical protein